ncbi:Crp/Fnr family transcriptional regulator [Singulisphaera acidiphila]|uniref:cAMP-binding protein n=1 Tax=Singulisphaera acidiphila (strain ATCC BAA-1392 / DSM 18658 / VKM B-2454 / MOB10) TaxID=886293 RepID=L0DQQ5_SINAD|nr:cyclic nucleotide-binding domain-containing protein [Singulisphaera acidiphila]AGA31313.1 cAMP-binding protein [Singulisphaera acidiphila DSM 18658]
MVKADVAEQFLAAPLLVDVDLDARQALLAMLEESHATAGAILLEQGEPNDHLSFLIEGSVVIERSLPGGRKETLAQLTAPAVFGTTSFFRPTPPTIAVRASTDVCILTMGHPAHEKLRRDDPRTAEALALAVVRVLAERFDLLDKRVSDFLAQHADDQPKTTEWSGFRARLFEEPKI